MPRTYSHLSYEQRLRVKGLLDKGTKKVDIARALGVHNATIYREIDRGSINGIYDPGHAEEQYRGHLSEKGRPTICSISPELAQHIAMLILEEKLSPAKIIDRLQEEKWSTAPKARATIYSAIDGGLIPGVELTLTPQLSETDETWAEKLLPARAPKECYMPHK